MVDRSKIHLSVAVAIITPVVTLKALEWVFQLPVIDSGHADSPLDEPAIVVDLTHDSEPNPRCSIAMTHVNLLRTQHIAASPFFAIEGELKPVEVEPAAEIVLPEISVQMVMSTREGPIALILGKPRRIGESIEENSPWFIREINPGQRTLLVELGSSGRFETIRVDTKSQNQ